MSNEPSLDLQAWLNTVLRADSAVGALVGDRIYDRVPSNATQPYIQLPDAQTVPEGVTGLDAFTVFPTLHAWSRAANTVEAKQIAGAVRDAIRAARDADPSASPTAHVALAGYTLQNIHERSSQFFREEGGLQTHVVMTYEARIAKER